MLVVKEPLGPADPRPHHHAEHGVAGDGKDSPGNGRGKARGEHIHHVLHCGKAQGDKDGIDHPVKPVVKIGVPPGPAEKDPVFDPLLHKSRHHEIGQKEVHQRPPGEEVNKLVGHHLQHQDGEHRQHPPEKKPPQQGPGLPLQFVHAVHDPYEDQGGQEGGGD